jgi:hypothetical protein
MLRRVVPPWRNALDPRSANYQRAKNAGQRLGKRYLVNQALLYVRVLRRVDRFAYVASCYAVRKPVRVTLCVVPCVCWFSVRSAACGARLVWCVRGSGCPCSRIVRLACPTPALSRRSVATWAGDATGPPGHRGKRQQPVSAARVPLSIVLTGAARVHGPSSR